MNPRLPPLNALLAFEAIVRHGSFSEAAEELCLTHGAVSHRIKLLESHLNAALLDRSTRQVVLTPAGRVYLSYVTQAIKLLHAAAAQIDGAPVRQWLKINVLPGLAGSWLISRLRDFRAQQPHIDIEIDPLTYPLSQFDAQRLDVAIRYCAGDFPRFRNLKLAEVKLFPACSPSYRRRACLDDPAGLVHENLLGHQADPWAIWFRHLGREDIDVEPSAVFGDSRLLVDAAVHGDGIALVRDVIAKREIEQGTLVKLFGIEAPSPKSYYAIAKQIPRQAQETEIFLQWLLEQANASA